MPPAQSIPRQLADACQGVREAIPQDSVAGVQPSFVAAPTSTQEASALLAAATELGLATVPRGSGTKLHWGRPPDQCDLVIEMTGSSRVTEHAAGDLTATVQAGRSLERLAGVLAAAGQRLALDPPVAGPAGSRGTVGGALAAGAAGPLRLRYGTARDLLIGITIVLADGTIARSGGKVVKNVAGYDLGKLLAGSRGTLGLITEATFRLHPMPAAAAYVTAQNAPPGVPGLLAAALEPSVSPVAAEIDWPHTDALVSVGVLLEGDPAGVSGRAAKLADKLDEAGGSAVTLSAEPPSWWGTHGAAAAGGTALQIAFWPGNLGATLAAIQATADQAELDAAVGGSAAAGVLALCLPAAGATTAAAVAAFVTALREAVGHGSSENRASVVVQHAPHAVLQLVDPFGYVPSLSLMRAVKAQFDPGRMLSPGRFAGGI